jgi:hypothetical protein
MAGLPKCFEDLRKNLIISGSTNMTRISLALTSSKETLLKISKKRIFKKFDKERNDRVPLLQDEGGTQPECKARKVDGFFLPHRDAPWRAVMKNNIESLSN